MAQTDIDPSDNSWMARGNCLSADPELFFPERGASTAEARMICNSCAVQMDCLDYAVRMGIAFGIWGGMSERERRRERRLRETGAMPTKKPAAKRVQSPNTRDKILIMAQSSYDGAINDPCANITQTLASGLLLEKHVIRNGLTILKRDELIKFISKRGKGGGITQLIVTDQGRSYLQNKFGESLPGL